MIEMTLKIMKMFTEFIINSKPQMKEDQDHMIEEELYEIQVIVQQEISCSHPRWIMIICNLISQTRIRETEPWVSCQMKIRVKNTKRRVLLIMKCSIQVKLLGVLRKQLDLFHRSKRALLILMKCQLQERKQFTTDQTVWMEDNHS